MAKLRAYELKAIYLVEFCRRWATQPSIGKTRHPGFVLSAVRIHAIVTTIVARGMHKSHDQTIAPMWHMVPGTHFKPWAPWVLSWVVGSMACWLYNYYIFVIGSAACVCGSAWMMGRWARKDIVLSVGSAVCVCVCVFAWTMGRWTRKDILLFVGSHSFTAPFGPAAQRLN